ncbi:UNVERIFIED_CONTAM: hypothetical protein FKN15_000866 [Acipenser sinensis]
MDGGALAEASLTNSYFSSSFIGVNGFGSPAEPKYSMMQRMTSSSSSPSLLNDKSYSPHGLEGVLTLVQSSGLNLLNPLVRHIKWTKALAPNPAASEFIPKGVSTPRMSNVSQSNMPAFSTALFSHPSMGSTSAAALAPGMSLSAGSSPLHSPKTTPHTSPAPRRRSHTPNPANYMVPTSASNPGSDPASQIIQKETVGGTTYFYTDTTPAPLAGMVFPQYHVYPPTAPHVAYMQPKANAPSFFMSDELRQELINRHLITMAQIDQSENPVPGMDGGALAEASLTNSYFSSSFIGVNGFGSPAEPKYSMMQVFPQYHVYPPTAPHVAYMQPKANAPSFFMSDELRQELINRHLITMAQIDQSENPGVPTEVDNYHSLFPLESLPPPNRLQKTSNFSYVTSCYKAVNSKDDLPYCLRRIRYHSLFPLESLPPPNRLQKTSNFSYVTSCYKAVNSKDDLPYCLRRIHGFRLVNTKCMVLVDMWKKIQHSNFVTLREVFTTKAFGEHSGQHDGPLPRQHAGLLPESLIWAYIVQLSSALRSIHTAGLACRVMDPTKILITGKTRLRVNCVGIFDVLTFDNSQTNPLALMAQYQQADLISLGKVVLALACNSLAGIQRENLQKAMELVSINYSSDLKNLILFQKDPTWSETGDRYLLKLFRDHLFHQVTEAGTPWIDLSHIVSCLNKLDSGVPEKISLVSRDEKSILVVTYADLKRCFESTFQELQAAANGQL